MASAVLLVLVGAGFHGELSHLALEPAALQLQLAFPASCPAGVQNHLALEPSPIVLHDRHKSRAGLLDRATALMGSACLAVSLCAHLVVKPPCGATLPPTHNGTRPVFRRQSQVLCPPVSHLA